MIEIQKPKRIGFTLIEVLVALLVFTIAAIALTQLISMSLVESRASQQSVTGMYLAHQKVEELRNTPYDEIVSGRDTDDQGFAVGLGADGLPGGVFFRSWDVVDNEPMNGTKTITITVDWEEGNRENTYKISTIIGLPFKVSEE